MDWRCAKLGLLIHDLLGVPTYKLEIRPEDFNRPLPGDWVFRHGATLEEKFADLSRVLADEQHLYIHFEKREGVRPVLVATGQLAYSPLNPNDQFAKDHLVHFYLGKPPRQINGMAIGDPNRLLQAIGESLGREVIYEGAGGNPATQSAEIPYYTWSNHLPSALTQSQTLEAVANIGRQLNLTFTPDQRNVWYWSATPISDSASSR